MRALLVGYGGIGKSVYYPELTNLGFDIHTLDLSAPGVDYRHIQEVKDSYDLAVIATPNYTHQGMAERLAHVGTKRIFIEKPGVRSAKLWHDMCASYSKTSFSVVKNNLYRSNYGAILEHMGTSNVIGVDINWLNQNRIPNPGSWFTDRDSSFGGVSRDLMPHLYCFAVMMFGDSIIGKSFNQGSYQRWDLNKISSTDYGKVDPNGIYNVHDVATAEIEINGISIRLNASWKEGYDKQSITLFFRHGGIYEWEFGLCPSDAYGKMLEDTTNLYDLDIELHTFLEGFNED